jgi:ABC-type nitrate/sulfonate/bicarbonate transport system substrate-binding protein
MSIVRVVRAVRSERATRRRGRAFAVVMVSVALALTGAGVAAGASGTRPESVSLTIPLSFTSAAGGYQAYAATQGFYKKYGLTVNAVGSDSTQVKSALTTGTAPLVSLNISDTLSLIVAGLPIKVIACQSLLVPFQVWSTTAVRTPKDLKGKTLGITSASGAIYATTVRYLQENGLRESDVTLLPLTSIPNVLSALISGRIDAGLLSFPYYQTAGQNSGLHKLGEAFTQGSSMVVRADWAKKNKNTIEAYLKGNVEGWAAYPKDPDKAMPALAKFLRLSLDDPAQKKTVEESYRLYDPGWTALGPCTANVFTPYEQFLTPQEKALAKKPQKLIDNGYVQDLVDSGFYAKVKKQYKPKGELPG